MSNRKDEIRKFISKLGSSKRSLASSVAAASGSAPLQYDDPLPQTAKECEYSFFVNNYVH